MLKNESCGFRVDLSLKNAIAEQARKEGRSFSSMVVFAVKQYLESVKKAG